MAQLKSGSTVGGKQISTVDHTHTPESIGAEGAGAAAAVQENLDSHAGNSGIHVTSTEKQEWTGKAPGVHYHDERYYTEGEVNNLLAAKAALSHNHAQSDVSGLVEALASGAKIATGSYVGTGTYGSSNPCSLTFDFVPKLLIVGIPVSVPMNGRGMFQHSFIWVTGNTSLPIWASGAAPTCYITASGKTISWYTEFPDPVAQANDSGRQYTYFAVG